MGLFTDFGSTYTKVVAIDLDNEVLVGQSQSNSTVDRNIEIGFQSALKRLRSQNSELLDCEFHVKLSSSSAAGGLGLVVIGLVPGLTMKAAQMAALGAGAKVKGAFCYKLNHDEILKMETLCPDIVLLAGGTNGGNEDVILHNARMLADSDIQAPIVVAGNKACVDTIKNILEPTKPGVTIVDNVLGDLDRLNVEPSREAIRQIFMNRIIHAKGLDKAITLVDQVLMPTPMAVLKAAEIMSLGSGPESGLGELILIDIGGATTDVHSIAHGHPSDPNVMEKGLPEPFSKRTVEGDLGLRYNAVSILEAVGIDRLCRYGLLTSSPTALEAKIKHLSEDIRDLPKTDEDFEIDIALARSALEMAVERHSGQLEQIFTSTGMVRIQRGKDLTHIKTIIGTGGIFAFGKNPLKILEGALFSDNNPLILKPKNPKFLIDKKYILFAIGLLADTEPEKAVRIGKKYLVSI
ncbi:MAG: glutamate mutase L [Deltaproteobacteria bacterium]|nr:glutamate mutase L [Deltaproteobacteria bacterium]